MNKKVIVDNETDSSFDDSEIKKTFENFENIEKEGQKNILVYFNRIHDKLFSFNNIMIAGFFAISTIKQSVPSVTILFPIVNLIILIYLEYRQMEQSRYEAQMTTKPITEITNYGKKIKHTTCYSLISIITTSIVIVVFLLYWI